MIEPSSSPDCMLLYAVWGGVGGVGGCLRRCGGAKWVVTNYAVGGAAACSFNVGDKARWLASQVCVYYYSLHSLAW